MDQQHKLNTHEERHSYLRGLYNGTLSTLFVIMPVMIILIAVPMPHGIFAAFMLYWIAVFLQRKNWGFSKIDNLAMQMATRKLKREPGEVIESN